MKHRLLITIAAVLLAALHVNAQPNQNQEDWKEKMQRSIILCMCFMKGRTVWKTI